MALFFVNKCTGKIVLIESMFSGWMVWHKDNRGVWLSQRDINDFTRKHDLLGEP